MYKQGKCTSGFETLEKKLNLNYNQHQIYFKLNEYDVNFQCNYNENLWSKSSNMTQYFAKESGNINFLSPFPSKFPTFALQKYLKQS